MPYTLGALQPEYAGLWRAMVPDASRDGAFLAACHKMQAGMAAYRRVEAATGVPAAVIAVIHIREANGDFATHLHNGDPLNQRTYHVPAGRPTIGDPPFTWEESATDALRYQGLTGLQWTIEQAAFRLEAYNGFGYRNKGLRSPYLWGGTNQQQPGKYVADGKFDPATVDRQLGCMPLLARLWSLDPSLALSLAGSPAQEPQEPWDSPDWLAWQAAHPNASRKLAWVQRSLNALMPGLQPIADDGLDGPLTRNRVCAFQRSHGLPVDGVAGDIQTIPEIKAVLAAPSGA